MRTSARKSEMVWSDAWVLLAIIYAAPPRNPTPLERIIAAGDFIGHAIFSRGELETGLSRRIHGGYVSPSGSRFSPTRVVRSFWNRSASKKRFVLDALDAVASFIGAPPWKPGLLPETTAQR
jgi:hypothetical protein